MIELSPQPGPQIEFLSSSADIAIYGGAAGGGKTFALLLETVRHVKNPLFNPVLFRREHVQISSPGGIWDTAKMMFVQAGARVREGARKAIVWPSGCKLSFDHLHNRDDVYNWQGAQIAFIGYDELTHFEESQFFYMLSRNRSICGVRPYIRATTNPDPDSWVAGFISWWIDQETGYPIPERAGKLRYFVRVSDRMYWADTPEELSRDFPESLPKSVTFVPARLSDNQILCEADPGYMANLMAMDYVNFERLYNGNWKIRPSAGMYFKRSDVTTPDSSGSRGRLRLARGWDLAATEPSSPGDDTPDWTVGVLIGLDDTTSEVHVLDVVRARVNAAAVRDLVESVAKMDGHLVTVVIPQDPGQAGKSQADSFKSLLGGFRVVTEVVTGSKVVRAEPLAADWQKGRVIVYPGHHVGAYLSSMESFPDGAHDDDVDATAVAYNYLKGGRKVTIGFNAIPRDRGII